MKSTARLLFLCAGLTLSACTGVRTLSSAVSSYGDWPAERKPGSYAFDRLPSQQAFAAESDALEANARVALERAGFKPVAAGETPELLVQIGARIDQISVSPWDDPLWWRGGFGYWRYGPWISPRWGLASGPGWGPRWDRPRYERQVALLIRDRASGKPLFESRASSEGSGRADAQLLSAMFEAAMADFPKPAPNPHRVDVVLAPPAP